MRLAQILWLCLIPSQKVLGYTTNARSCLYPSTVKWTEKESRPLFDVFDATTNVHRRLQSSKSVTLFAGTKNAENLLPLKGYQRIPTILTCSRCFALPAFLLAFYRLPAVWSISIFAAASLTDFLDGYLARKWNATSDFGAFLDPVADKLMVAAVLLPISGKYGAPVAIPSALILMREIGVSALREWMAIKQLRDIVKVGFLGKCKTSLTLMALTLFLMEPLFPKLYNASLWILWICSGITVWSGFQYFRSAVPYF